MTSGEQILFNSSDTAGRGRRLVDIHESHHFILTTGTTITGLSNGATSSPVTWLAPTPPETDRGRYFDPGLPDGLWAKGQGYFLVTVNVKVTFGSTPAGSFRGDLLTIDTDWVSSWENAVTTDTIAFDMTGATYLADESYIYVNFTNNSGENADIYTRIFMKKVG